MTTLDRDMIRWSSPVLGVVNMWVKDTGLEWPPPEYIILTMRGFREPLPDDPPDMVLHRVSMSELSDEQAAGSAHIGRGAEYVYPFQEASYELYGDVTYFPKEE